MKITGKCKEDFEKWYLHSVETNYIDDVHVIKDFYAKLQSMQNGVYVDFFDSVKYEGEGLFSLLFKVYYQDKTDDFSHNDIVKNTLEACIESYNEHTEY